MMEVGTFVGNAQKQFNSMMETASLGIEQSAKILGPESLPLAQDLFTSDIIEQNPIGQSDPIILPEAEFPDPMSFFESLFEALTSPQFLEALTLPFLALQKELNNFAQTMKELDPGSFELPQEKSAVQDLQSEITNQIQLYDQANSRTFNSGLPKIPQSFQNTIPLSPDAGGQFLKDQLNNSFNTNPGNYHYESRQQYGDRPMSKLPAYGSQGKTLAEMGIRSEVW